jgi:acyl carrier protein
MSPTDREALIGFLESRALTLPQGWNDDTRLIHSGILDSLALFELILWLEERLGEPVDPTRVELAEELDTVRDILGFLERRRGEGLSPSSR